VDATCLKQSAINGVIASAQYVTWRREKKMSLSREESFCSILVPLVVLSILG